MRILTSVFLFTALLFAQDDFETVLNTGVAAFKNAEYAQAGKLFERAVAMRPQSVAAHTYLGTARMTQWIPGGQSPENIALYIAAHDEFEQVLRLSPSDKTALHSLASLTYNNALSVRDRAEKERRLDDAKSLYERLIQVDTADKDAYYSIAVINWIKFYPAFTDARTAAGMRPEDPGP